MTNLKTRFGMLVLLSAAGYLVSFASQLVLAYYYGTSQVLDIYWGGLALVSLLSFYMPPLKEALVPAVHRGHARGDSEAGKVLSAGLSLLLMLATGSSIVLFLLSKGFSVFLAGSSPSAAGGVVSLTTWLVAYLFVFVLAETLNTTLVSFNQVLRQAAVRIAAALVVLVTIAIAGASLGVGGLLLAQILSMATLIVASGWSLRHLRLRFHVQPWPELRTNGMLPLFYSLLITYLFSQLYVLVERSAMIHLGTGLVSGFQYSTALVNVLVSLLAYPLANLLWSQFLAKADENDGKAAQVLVVRACGLLAYVLTVACVFVWINAREIVAILYGRGAFDEASVQLTTTALRATIFTAIPISITSILGRWLMSLPGAHRQVWIGLTTTVVGFLVIGAAVLADSSQWLMLHWLLANFAGMLVSVSIFAYSYGFGLGQKLAAAKWLVLAGLIAFLAAWLTPSISLDDSKAGMAVALLAKGVMYLINVLLLTWIFRMVMPLRLMFRGR